MARLQITVDVIRTFLVEASEWDDYPHNAKNASLFEYDPDADDEAVQELCKRVLKTRKGAGYAQRLVELCSDGDLPAIIIEALERISEDLPNELSAGDGDDDDDDDDDPETPGDET